MVFIATLVLWAFLKGHGPAIHPSFDTREIMRLFESVPSTYSLLRGSTKYMVNNKRWKLGQGFALVLARMMDLDEAPSSPPLRSPQSAHSL
jgi:hypothetical protein